MKKIAEKKNNEGSVKKGAPLETLSIKAISLIVLLAIAFFFF